MPLGSRIEMTFFRCRSELVAELNDQPPPDSPQSVYLDGERSVTFEAPETNFPVRSSLTKDFVDPPTRQVGHLAMFSDATLI